MKKLLLSAAIAAACAGSAYAQSFEIYGTTDLEAGDFTKITDGQTINIENRVVTDEYTYGDKVYTFYNVKAELYVYIVNSTSTAWDAASKNSPEFSFELKNEKDELPDGIAKPEIPSNCFGGSCWSSNPFWITCPANSQTETGEGNHIGFDLMCDSEAQANITKINRTYEYTAKLGTESLNFTLVFGDGGTNSVEGIEADLNAPKEYYTLQGMKVAEPQKGSICIVKQGNKVSKQVIR